MESTPRLRLSHALIELADLLLHELVSTKNSVNKIEQIKKPKTFLIIKKLRKHQTDLPMEYTTGNGTKPVIS